MHKSKAAVCLPHEKEQANFVHIKKEQGNLVHMEKNSCLNPSSVKLNHPPRHTDLIQVTFKTVVDAKGKTQEAKEGIFLQHNYTARLYCCQLQ